MAPKSRGRISVPTTKPLHDGLRLPANSPHVWRTLSKLSRPSLLSLAAQWCEEDNLKTCGPYILGEDEDDDLEAAYAGATSIAEVEGLYAEELPARKGSKREVVDRILEGDWRHGISMKQLAMAETQYILDHTTANRWTALRLAPHNDDQDDDDEEGKGRDHLPRLHTATFLRALQAEISPLAKAHYHIHDAESLPLTVLRIYLHDTPYNTTSSLRTLPSHTHTQTQNQPRKPSSTSAAAALEAPKSIFILFPRGTPYIYVSLSSSGTNLTDPEAKSLQKFAVDAIPKALSKPGRRFQLKSTGMNARSLTALLAHRGAERSNAAGGGWSIFVADARGRNALDFGDADAKAGRKAEEDGDGEGNGDADGGEANKENAATLVLRGTAKRPFQHEESTISEADVQARKRLKRLAASRFGDYGVLGDGRGLHSFSVQIRDAFDRRAVARKATEEGLFVEDDEDGERASEGGGWKPDIRLTFQGAHVFAGLRVLVEKGVVDAARMPGWMTGEAGVSVGVVREGRIETQNI